MYNTCNITYVNRGGTWCITGVVVLYMMWTYSASIVLAWLLVVLAVSLTVCMF